MFNPIVSHLIQLPKTKAIAQPKALQVSYLQKYDRFVIWYWQYDTQLQRYFPVALFGSDSLDILQRNFNEFLTDHLNLSAVNFDTSELEKV